MDNTSCELAVGSWWGKAHGEQSAPRGHPLRFFVPPDARRSNPVTYGLDAPCGKLGLEVSSVRLTTKVNSLPARRMICFWCLKRL